MGCTKYPLGLLGLTSEPMWEPTSILLRRRAEGITKACIKGVSESGKEPDHPGGVHIMSYLTNSVF